MNNQDKTTADEAFRKFLVLRRYLRHYAQQMKSQGISPRDFSVLRFLDESGPVTVGDVQSYLYQSPSTASTVVAQLEKAGYVTRQRSEADNRVVMVELTPAGRKATLKTPLAGLALLRRRLKTLSAERLHLIDQALTEIMQLMEVPDTE